MGEHAWRKHTTNFAVGAVALCALFATLTAGILGADSASADPATLVAIAGDWHYLDAGARPEPGWQQVDFDDTAWKVGDGPFGYGGDQADRNTTIGWGPDSAYRNITTYFRKGFELADPAAFATYTIEVQYDDAVIVTVNGHEVYRDNLPDGRVTHPMWANLPRSDSDQVVRLPIPRDLVESGTNVVAAEVHQASTADDDLRFALRLVGAPAAPRTVPAPGTIMIPTTSPATTVPAPTTAVETTVIAPASTTSSPAAPLPTTPATSTTTVATTTAAPVAAGARLVAVGDIGICGGVWPERVASIVRSAGGRFAMLGDAAYPSGSATDYQNCYDPSFGDLKSRTVPVPGNHDYMTGAADAYRGYFGSRATPNGTTWYSYDLGGWHIVALDTECGSNGGCGVGSPQYRWLAADLAAHPNSCLAVTAHRPLWASGTEENDPTRFAALSGLAFDHGADLWLSGHAHNYERFGRLDRNGNSDPNGLRALIVGTGGGGMYDFNTVAAGSQIRNNTSWGALVLDLKPGGYSWNFENATNNGFTDSGSDTC